ncbi:Mitochondrial acidic protein mam33 [Marasmius tenuissimus]|nr:Mitochondrial acidic protein mam33 [Marasmius tenuissimus]
MSAIRALRQLSRAASTSTAALRSTSRISAASLSRASFTSSTRAFSVSARSFGQGATDSALLTKIAEELKYETENVPAETPEFLTAFKAQGVWEVEDSQYQDEVVLTRKFGNETLRLMFSIADIRAEEDEAFNEEAAERNEDGEAEHDEEILNSYPIRVSLTVTKPSAPGSLSVDMLVQDGSFVTDNITFYRDSKIGTELSAEADWKRRGIYLGPQFDTLDVGLQEEFDKWLQERGINESIALFIPEYAEWKEQAEYVRWLEGVKGFIEQ